MAERLNASVLKTDDGDESSGGSNPSLSASFICVTTPTKRGNECLMLVTYVNIH